MQHRRDRRVVYVERKIGKESDPALQQLCEQQIWKLSLKIYAELD
jgi:hypothetical protein